MGIIARKYSLRRVAPLSSSSLCFLSQFCMAQELEMVVGMVWYGMVWRPCRLLLIWTWTWSWASVGVAVAVLEMVRDGSGRETCRIGSIHHGIQIRVSFSNTTEASFIKTDRNAGRSCRMPLNAVLLQTDRDGPQDSWPEHSTMMSGIHLVIRRSPPGGAARVRCCGCDLPCLG
jgi:hypothetical protein